MKLSERQHEFAVAFCELLSFLLEEGYQVAFGDAWRSTSPLRCYHCEKPVTYQELLRANGKSKVKYGDHNDRCAVDLILRKGGVMCTSEQYRPAGEFWESLGGEWGGRYGVKVEERGQKVGWDANHFGWGSQ